MKKALIILGISIAMLAALGVVYFKSKQEEKPKVVSLREQYQQELRDGAIIPNTTSVEQKKTEKTDKKLTKEKDENEFISEETGEKDFLDEVQVDTTENSLDDSFWNNFNFEFINTNPEGFTEKALSGLKSITGVTGSKYNYSSDLYFDIKGNYTNSTKDLMDWLNKLADKIEQLGYKQAPIDYDSLNNATVKFIEDNYYFNPDQQFDFCGLYQIMYNTAVPYLVKPESCYNDMGKHEWELVLNKFMEAVLSYASVKEAKKYVDIDIAYKVAEPGEDISKHTAYTDPIIAKIIAMAAGVYEAHPDAVMATGTYVLGNVGQIGDVVAARVYPILSWYTYEKVDYPVELYPNNVYMTEYDKDEKTGELYELCMHSRKLSFFLTMTKDDSGDWKIVCIE